VGAKAGYNLTNGGNNIDIGHQGVAGDARKIRIGTAGVQTATFVAGIRGVTVPSGVGVIVGSNHQLGTVQSSKRFKEAIKPMDKASKSIFALNPVTFRYKKEIDPDRILQFGLIAEDVLKVNPDLVVRDENGKVSSVRYEEVNVMLLNEFLKEHRRVEEQGATIAKQQKQIEALIAGLHKVSAQLELSRPAPQTVKNN
jgi:Chaperone of endosialidase